MESPLVQNLNFKQLDELPDDTLINHVLPSIPIEQIFSLCQVNRRWAALCRDERVWIIRLQREFPNSVKPLEVTWRELYLYLRQGGKVKIVPVYMNGDAVGFVPMVGRILPSQSLKRLLGDVKVTLVFIDPNLNYNWYDYPYFNPINQALPISGGFIPKSRGRKPRGNTRHLPLQFETNEMFDVRNTAAIIVIPSDVVELTKSLLFPLVFNPNSRIPIYGVVGSYISEYESLGRNYATTIVEGNYIKDSRLRIVDLRPTRNNRLFCEQQPNSYLIDILSFLYDPTSINTNLDNSMYCELIKNKLRQIGHLLE